MRFAPRSRLTGDRRRPYLVHPAILPRAEAAHRNPASESETRFLAGRGLVRSGLMGAREAFMRIALPHFAFELSPPRLAHWRSELQSWRRRARERGELARMSDGELHDIGVSSAERWAEINKPCWRG